MSIILDIEAMKCRDLSQVELLDPNVVHSSSGLGHWTMIYDEAFEVNVDDLSFLAFFRFERLNDMEHGPKGVEIEGFRMIFLQKWLVFRRSEVE